MKTVIRALIVFSGFGFHNSWLSSRTIRLFIIRTCFLHCSVFSAAGARSCVCRDVNEDTEQR